MKTLYLILIGIVILSVLLFINSSVINSNMNDIKEHFTKENKEVKNIDYQYTIIGSPFFYVNKGQHIFKVELTNNEVWWVRTGVFTDDYEKDK